MLSAGSIWPGILAFRRVGGELSWPAGFPRRWWASSTATACWLHVTAPPGCRQADAWARARGDACSQEGKARRFEASCCSGRGQMRGLRCPSPLSWCFMPRCRDLHPAGASLSDLAPTYAHSAALQHCGPSVLMFSIVIMFSTPLPVSTPPAGPNRWHPIPISVALPGVVAMPDGAFFEKSVPRTWTF